MQNKKDCANFNIRKIFRKAGLSQKLEEFTYTPEHESEKWVDSTYTNPKREKDFLIDQSVNEAVLMSKTYIDLKKSYQENKRKHSEGRKQAQQEIEQLKTEKEETTSEQMKLEAECQKCKEAIVALKKRITETRQWNQLVRESLHNRISSEAEYLSNLIVSMRFQAEYEHDIDPDQMTYEELLELQEKIGQVSRGLPQEAIDSLPKRLITKASQNNCVVCCCSFEEGESITTLDRCKHQFHFDCLQEWLQKEKICPMCKQEIL